jgi:nicotinamidase-related amidase
MKKALFIVDPQLNFMTGGSQEASVGNRIIHDINSIMTNKFDVVIASKLNTPNTTDSEFHPDLKFNGEIFTRDSDKRIVTAINSKRQTIHDYFKKK